MSLCCKVLAMKIDQQIIWLTGASSGIGEALTYELNSRGATLIISARNEAKLLEVKQRCAYPDRIQVLPVDLYALAELPEQSRKALNIWGNIDTVIHCAGVSQRSLAQDTVFAVDQQLMNINYFAPVCISKALLPYFFQQKQGHFVVVSSVVGKYGTPLRSGYSGSKHALHGFFDSLRAETSKLGIKVTLICPGFIHTNLTMNALTGDGSPQLKMDSTTANGIPPAVCAQKIAQAIEKEAREVIIAGVREKAGVYAKRFLPALFARIIPNMKVA